MPKFTIYVLPLSLGLLGGALLQSISSFAQSRSKPKVVATSSIICDMTKTIAKDTIDLKCLIKGGVDAHIYKPTTADRKAIEDAQLTLYSGYNFEESLIKLIRGSKKGGVKVAVAEIAVPNPQKFSDDGALVVDPHVFHNAKNGMAMVKVIENNLSKLQPKNKQEYTKAANSLNQELTKIDTWIKSGIPTIPASKRKLVTTHDALGYYSKAYGIPIEGALQGVSTEEKPTAKRIKELVEIIKASGVPTIFAEVSINPKLLQAVAKDAKVQVWPEELYTDGLGEAGSTGDTYPKMLISNTKNIVQGLGGKTTKL